MRFLFKALLAATALIPVATAASAQDAPGREGRWRGNRGGGAEAKIEARNEARGIEAPRAQRQPQPQTQPQLQAQPRWERSARTEANGEVQRQPRAERRWDGNRGGADGSVRAEARSDARAELRQQRQAERGGWDRRAAGRSPVLPEANVAVNRPGGADWNNPRADRRNQGQVENRQNWNAQRQYRRDDGRVQSRDDQRRNDRDGWNRQNRDDGRWNNRDGWNGQNRDRNDWARNGRYRNGGNWNRSWRNDRRYDWSGYRATNRSAYRLPRYYAPYGWSYGYRRFSVGVTLNNLLWGQNYWIEDPYAYRLPEVDGPYRWVRYYGDALLVDIRTGRVIDVVHEIFW